MTFDRTKRIELIPWCYGGARWVPHFVVSRCITPMFGPYPTIVCFIVLTWNGKLKRYSLQ